MYSKQIKIDSTLGSGSRVRSFYVNSSDSHLRKPVDLKTFNRPREPVTTGQGFLFYLFIYLFIFVCLFVCFQMCKLTSMKYVRIGL